MDDIRVGRVIRELRRRLHWRQRDLANRAGVSQQAVSLLERGQLESLGLRTARRIAQSLDAALQVDIRWRGGELDRLVDAAHALLIATTIDRLVALGWETRVEVTYSVFGDRGSIDVVAWRGVERALLVIEVKSELTSVEATLRKHDEKVRLAKAIVSDRFGWSPRLVSRLLVLPESTTSRRRIHAAGGLVAGSYPLQGLGLRTWLKAPAGAIAGLLFLPSTSPRGGKRRIRSRNPRIVTDHVVAERDPGRIG